MCDVIDTADADAIMTIGDLKSAFVVDPSDFEFPDDHDEMCLCNVDIPAVLDRAGVQWKRGPWGYVIEGARHFDDPWLLNAEEA